MTLDQCLSICNESVATNCLKHGEPAESPDPLIFGKAGGRNLYGKPATQSGDACKFLSVDVS